MEQGKVAKNMSWEMVNINKLCRPRQWKTLSMEKLTKEGYPVYGANGKIGFYNEFSHEHPTLAITCRGATCGSVHITEPKSYINGNAMALDNISDKIDIKFLYYFFLQRGFNDVISGSAQPQITGEGLSKIQIPLPPLPIQKRIAELLDAADALRRKDQELLKKYDQLAQAIFIDMFGDPVKNEKGWEMNAVIEYCDCIVPGRDKPKSFTGSIPWVTTDDLNHLDITQFSKKSIGLTKLEIEQVRAKVIPSNSVIMTCVGDLGIVSVNSKEIVINQQLHAFQCGIKMNPYFLMYNLSKQKDFMLKMSSSTTVPYMNKTVCNSIPVICPPIKLQNLFSDKLTIVRNQLTIIKNSPSNTLFQTLIQKAFKGELVN